MGGAANEVGAMHRAGVAALVAVHGLRGENVPWLASDSPPVQIDLESDFSVDDILVRFADGSKAFIQAKVSSDLGAPFKSAVSQWCEAVKKEECNDGDQLLLVVAEPSGTLKKLARHLVEYQNKVALSKEAAESLKVFRSIFAARGVDEAAAERILRAAAVRFIDARLLGSEEGQGAAWLDAAVVVAGRGMSAFSALRAAIRDEATSRGSSSSLDRWRHWLSKAEIPLLSDKDGLLAARLQAEEDAIAEYRSRLAQNRDMLPLADLNFGLTSIHIPGLAESLKATCIDDTLNEVRQGEKEDLLNLVRREGRMVIVGLPGAGKSVALQLVAAEWSSNKWAPLAVQAKLSDLARMIPKGGPYRLSIEEVVKAATQGENSLLADAMARKLQRGEAVLLLDALDEVIDNRDAIVEAIARFLQCLPISTDIVITTRHSSSQAARLLNFPMFELNEPENLDSTLDVLLQELAEKRGAESTGWLEERRLYIEASRSTDRHLWQVPLLATLMVFLLVERAPQAMPNSRAILLVEIIEASVHRWEARRTTTGIPGISASLTSQVLLDCYDDIAHHVAEGKAEWNDVLGAVDKRLQEYWGKSKGEAKAAAQGVLNHWDATAGVFVTSHPGGRLSARTRLFAEIGAARWVLRDDDRAEEWLRDSLADPELRECVRLAAGLSVPVMRSLCDLALEQRNDLLDLVLSAMEDGAQLDESRRKSFKREQINRISALPLTPTREKIGKLRIPGHSAPAKLAIRLARLNLSEDELQLLCDRANRLGAWQSIVVQAIALASQASSNGRKFPSTVLDVLEQALFDPDREEESSSRPAGLDQVVQLALKELVPSRPLTAFRVAATAYRCSVSIASNAEFELKRLGHEGVLRDARPEHNRFISDSARRAIMSLGNFDRNSTFRLMMQITRDRVELTPMQAWHLDEASALVQVLDINYAGIGLLDHATVKVPTITLELFRCIAAGYMIDMRKVAAELESLQYENSERPDWFILVTPSRRRPIPKSSLPTGSPGLILQAFETNNEWLANLAVDLAWDAVDLTEEWRDQVVALRPALAPEIRKSVSVLIAHKWPNYPAPSDPVSRSGFARIAAHRFASQSKVEDAAHLLRDPDLLVRENAAEILSKDLSEQSEYFSEALSSPAEQWTCIHCDRVIDINSSACGKHHARPDPSVTN
ncbi:NACHT domain-containing protein [Streptomyces sp. NPDC008196]|uniref:NACHT domain-containing protein n=1 Tax=Streptomyces sp. NPDC008196 TaxID=3364819 RepID=UPI0036E22BB1